MFLLFCILLYAVWLSLIRRFVAFDTPFRGCPYAVSFLTVTSIVQAECRERTLFYAEAPPILAANCLYNL